MSLFGSNLLRVAEFATKVHAGHVRKYTGEPYMVHCLSVAQVVANLETATEDMIKAAILHDTVEDWPGRTSFEEIEQLFGPGVRDLVFQCTEMSVKGEDNRAARKEIDRKHFSAASPAAQTIKLADLLDNSRTILLHDLSFGQVYFAEKRELLKSMNRGHPMLHYAAQRVVDEYFKAQEKLGGI